MATPTWNHRKKGHLTGDDAALNNSGDETDVENNDDEIDATYA